MTGAPWARVRRRAVNIWARARSKARSPRVSTRVAENENMLNEGTLHLYFEIGASALGQIQEGLAAAGAGSPTSILDLPSGYGRVLRHLRAEWPDAEITAMELNADAARFCSRAFGARPVISRDPLWEVEAGENFELLWSGSLLTHFDGDIWPPTLAYFRDRLAPGGTLVFTTHGELPIDVLAGEPHAAATLGRLVGDYGVPGRRRELAAAARRDGFAFGEYASGHPGWGVSFATPEWVLSTVRAVGGLEFVHHAPAGWFGHQDVWTFTLAERR